MKHAPARNLEYICPKKNGLHIVQKKTSPVFESEFLLQTDSGYPKDTGVVLFTMANNGNHFSICLCRNHSFFLKECKTCVHVVFS